MLHRLLLSLSCWVLLFSTSHLLAQDCSTPYLPTAFKAKRAWFSNLGSVATNSTPIVANLNPQEDDIPEIIVSWTKGLGPSNPWITNKLEIYRGDGSNFYFPMVLTIPGDFDQSIQGPVVGDINNDGIPELLMFCEDWRIRVFKGYKEDLTEPMTLWVTSPTIDSTTLATLGYQDLRISLADFDGDGIPEVYTGSDIFSFDFSKPASPVLTQVIAGQFFQGRTIYGDYGHGACSPVAVDILSVADCNGDPDCAGLELVAGPVIYSIDLDLNDGDGIEIKIQRNLNQLQSSNIYEDGYTSVGDLDLDGVLDIAVSGRRDSTERGVYAWNKNGLLQFFPFPINDRRSGSLPCIANVYKDDGSGLDFPEILVSSHGHFNCFNLNAAQKTPATPYWWSMPVPAPSGFSNGTRAATVFDFNGDGLSEILLKDYLFLKIMYGGPAPFPPGVDAERNWYTAQCRSWGGDGYPVVADVDNDCEAEIVVAGSFTHSNDIGHLQVFESGGSPWAPCRNLWNQYNYMAINVNDDLSIPSPQMPDHHLELPATGSGKRPFNNYLVQRPSFNEDFEVATPLPDATIQVKKSGVQHDHLHARIERLQHWQQGDHGRNARRLLPNRPHRNSGGAGQCCADHQHGLKTRRLHHDQPNPAQNHRQRLQRSKRRWLQT